MDNQINNQLKIKLLSTKDLEVWKLIRLEALQDAPESFGSSYEEEVAHSDAEWKQGLKNSDIFGAFIDNNLIACAGFFSLMSLKTKHRGVLWGMYTKPEYRGQGLAGALIQSIINHAKSRVMQLHLTCVTSNLGALTLYQKNGFKIYGTEPRALKIGNDYFDENLMVLNLSND